MLFETYERQNVPTPQDRIETGVIAFEGDSPGLFIRGDDCMMIEASISAIMHFLDKHAQLNELREISQAIGTVSDFRRGLSMVQMHSGAIAS